VLIPMRTFACYTNGEHQGFIKAVSLRQAQERARKRYGKRVDVIGEAAKAERNDSRSQFSQSRVGECQPL
jgi:hypothetical protein